jgi:prevent-host-death family protein
MKTIAVTELRENAEAVVGSAQSERILLTRNGRPSAVLMGIEDYDGEDLALARSADFWKMIEGRRRGREIPLAEVKATITSRRPRPTRKATSKSRKR